jgi:ketosteroid isomerase-like protein
MIMETLVAVAAVAALGASPDASSADAVKSMQETYAAANAALLRGDAETWSELAPLGEDFVLFSPFGGTPSRYADYTPERIERMSHFFRNGKFRQEVVQTFSADDIIVLATIERCNVEVGGLPAQDWALRVTSVFKRERGGWKLVHRHADPFVEDVSLAEAARLARGERAQGSK